MKRLLSVGIVTLVLAIAHSSVYACDHTAKAEKASKASKVTTTTSAKTIRTLVVGATTGCQVSTDHVMAFEIDVPGRTNPKFIHIEATESGRHAPSAFRTAVTLGRAFVTTVEAVFTALLDAASEKTASLV
jgi:hypothetical protein